ncbi:MAG: beta-propeller domain-containing protein [Candidatus Aenigmatarchaeota archaeon]
MENKYIFSSIFISVLLVIFISGCVDQTELPTDQEDTFSTFKSAQDFKEYIKQSGFDGSFMGNLAGSARTVGRVSGTEQMAETMAKGGAVDSAQPERVSETNVQVLGIDEPDIVKTDGNNIYFSMDNYWGNSETKIISAFPVENLSLFSEIDRSGKLFLKDDVLIVFSRNEIYGYDVSDPSSPEEKWEIEMNGSLIDARLYEDKIYLVTQNKIDQYSPCPIRPFTVGGKPITVSCGDIYHPSKSVPIDLTYNAIALDPASGEIGKRVSFVGSTGKSVVYMSKNGIYVTYTYSEDPVEILYGFFEENADIIPSNVLNRIENLRTYDISPKAKLTELQVIMEEYINSMSEEKRMKFENEFQNRMNDYYDKHKRKFEKTGIAKIDLESMDVVSNGNIPGSLLNQFSLDEYENNLRIATTVGRGDKSVNDVYVLDKNLNIMSSVKDLGETERIYSVRFMGDKGYVVTYRRIDPFYVLDLSEPSNPEMKGKLKIPGYSSYLHPLNGNKILGIGEEDNKVKISLFDVSDPENPQEIDKYSIDEYWSEVSKTHHAFLLDKKHEIFFLPGSKGGYIFSYTEDEIKLERVVSTHQAKRAIYINDYLYILSQEEIVVLDENNWKEVDDLELDFELNNPYRKDGGIPVEVDVR